MSKAEICLGILEASRNGDLARVQRMLDNGAEINSQDIFDGYTPLHYAIGSGNAELVRFLIHRGADIEHNNNTVHQTPLATAVLASRIEIVELLLESDIDIARRTVAKYREAMHIPSSVQRRRLKSGR